MNSSLASVGRRVRCPICVDTFSWPDGTTCWLYDEREGMFRLVDLAGLIPEKRADVLRQAYVQCPNPSGDTATHYLPATYASYADPIVIALVGAPASGKTHLLAAMVAEIFKGSLTGLGVLTSPLDLRRHAEFSKYFLQTVQQGRELPGTSSGNTGYAYAFLMRTSAGQRPVVFFDIAGEDFEYSSPGSSRFILAVDALIFTCPVEDSVESARRYTSAMENTIARLKLLERIDKVAAAVVMTKADHQRFVHPVRNWLWQPQERVLQSSRIRKESRDVYAFLHSRGEVESLAPFDVFRRCTLHFASATGGDAGPSGRFERGVRPLRVLEPLVSILAMTGVLDGAEAKQVGR